MRSVLLYNLSGIFRPPPLHDQLVAAPCQDAVPQTFETTAVRQETKFHTHAKQALQL
jgi:hypothetical protein